MSQTACYVKILLLSTSPIESTLNTCTHAQTHPQPHTHAQTLQMKTGTSESNWTVAGEVHVESIWHTWCSVPARIIGAWVEFNGTVLARIGNGADAPVIPHQINAVSVDARIRKTIVYVRLTVGTWKETKIIQSHIRSQTYNKYKQIKRILSKFIYLIFIYLFIFICNLKITCFYLSKEVKYKITDLPNDTGFTCMRWHKFTCLNGTLIN